MKIRTVQVVSSSWLVLVIVLIQGCASAPSGYYAHHYLQRSPVRVAIIPSDNKTDKPEATIAVDKAWETALGAAGFEVVNADQVVTYAASVGTDIQVLKSKPVGDLGRDLKVNALLFSEITQWDTKYMVVKSGSVVAGISRLIEASTGGLIFEHHWVYEEQSGNGGGSVIGMLVDAAVTAAIHSATDEATRMGQRAVAMSAHEMPRPGYAPSTAPESVP
jgi:hypothetical protein